MNFLCCVWTRLRSLVHICLSVFTEGMRNMQMIWSSSTLNVNKRWVPRQQSNAKKRKKNPETRDNKAVPGIAYRLSSTITLRSKFKVLKSGDTVALLIRSEAELLNHIHTVDGQSRFLLLQFMFQPRSVLETQPSTFVSSQRLQRQSEEGRTIPARKNLSLNAAKMIFFLVPFPYIIYFTRFYNYYAFTFFPFAGEFFSFLFFSYKMCSALPNWKFQKGSAPVHSRL